MSLKKVLLFIVVLLALALLVILFLLDKTGEDPDSGVYTPPPPEPKTIAPGSLLEFKFDHRGMSIPEFFTYRAAKEGDVTLVDIDCGIGNLIIQESLPLSFLEDLEKLLIEKKVGEWNGFDGSNAAVKDGTGFNLEIRLDSKEEISASGSNSFPSGYWDFLEEMEELFSPLIEAAEGEGER